MCPYPRPAGYSAALGSRQRLSAALRHDEIGFRNARQEADYDERGSQSPGPGEPPIDEGDAVRFSIVDPT
jgi:hypothetical protein